MELKKIAIDLINEAGLINLTRAKICERAGIPDGSFTYAAGMNFTDMLAELVAEGHGGGSVEISRKRIDPKLRREQLLAAAVNVAQQRGYKSVTRDSVAELAGVSGALVAKYFGTMTQLRNAIVVYAIKNKILDIVAQCILDKNPHAEDIPQSLRDAAIQHAMGA